MWRVGRRPEGNGGTSFCVGLKVNAGKGKVVVPSEEGGLECEVCVDGMRLERVSGFKYLRYFGRIRYR